MNTYLKSVKYETDKPWITTQFKSMVKARQHARNSVWQLIHF